MSHIVSIDSVTIDNLDALRAAVAQMGFEWVEGQRTYAWYGEWIGDSPMPKGMTQEELGTCDHAIRVPECKYEVGVLWTGSKYELRYDFYAAGGLGKVLGEVAAPLVQEYAAQAILGAAALNGQTLISREVLEDGTIEMYMGGN